MEFRGLLETAASFINLFYTNSPETHANDVPLMSVSFQRGV